MTGAKSARERVYSEGRSVMHLTLIVLSALLALGSAGLAAHRSQGSSPGTVSSLVCPTPPPGSDDGLGGQPSRC
jgi:hypothetical protein